MSDNDEIERGGGPDWAGALNFLSRTMEGLRKIKQDIRQYLGTGSIDSTLHWAGVVWETVRQELEEQENKEQESKEIRKRNPFKIWMDEEFPTEKELPFPVMNLGYPWPVDPGAPSNFNNHPETNINKWREAADEAIRSVEKPVSTLHAWAKKLHAFEERIFSAFKKEDYTEAAAGIVAALQQAGPKIEFADMVACVEQAYSDFKDAAGDEEQPKKPGKKKRKILELKTQLALLQELYDDAIAKRLDQYNGPKFEMHTGLLRPTVGVPVHGEIYGKLCICWWSGESWWYRASVDDERRKVAVDSDILWYKKI